METDPHYDTRGPGEDWRAGLHPDHDALVRRWEDDPRAVGTGKVRNDFRKLLSTAPTIDGPVYRGDSPKNSYGFRDKIEKPHQPGKIISFPRWSSTSTRPEVASGFGHVIYEIHGHNAKGIGNTLHEGVMPPGKFQVHSAEWNEATPTRAGIDGKTMSTSPRLHVVLHPVDQREARKEPNQRIFGPTYGLDARLFDGDHLKPAVRTWLLDTIGAFWQPLYGTGWRRWTRVYFAGSEASAWTSESLVGNGDFDTLVGIRPELARKLVPGFEGLDDDAMVARLNADLTTLLWPRLLGVSIPTGDGTEAGPFDVTVFVNLKAWSIADIKPYAAYNVTADAWAVRPPVLTDWSIESFPQGHALVQECHAVASYVRAVLAMPEPYRSQQGDALWRHLHSDRGRSFTDQGEGWFDSGNVIEKYLDQLGLWEPLAKLHFDAADDPSKLLTPAGWSNDPRSS